MTVPNEDLADVFEHLGTACSKLSQILKTQNLLAAPKKPTNRKKKDEAPTEEELKRTALVVSEATANVSNLLLTPAPSSPPTATAPTQPEKKERRKIKSVLKVHDPNAPKRPLTAFILFTKEKRPLVHAAHPGLTFKELALIMAKEWEKCDKAPWFERSKALKEAFYKERADSERASEAAVEQAAGAAKETSAVDGKSIEPAKEQQKTPKTKAKSPGAPKRSRLEDIPVAVASGSDDIVLSQELIPNTSTTILPPLPELHTTTVTSTIDQEKKEKKKRKKMAESSAPAPASMPVTQPSLPTQPAPVVPQPTTTQPELTEPEKKKKKKKKNVEGEAALGLLSTQPLPIH
jgi:hypothetical protein